MNAFDNWSLPFPRFQMINAVTDIQEDTVVEVVISAQSLGEDDVEIRPHALSIHSYKSPTFCHFCGEMLFGMFKQVRATWVMFMIYGFVQGHH